MKLIAFTGKMYSGKTTAVSIITRMDTRYTRIRFAGPLKMMMSALGLTAWQIDGKQKNMPCELLCGKTPREAMQTLGTDWGRDLIGNDLWVNAWRHQVNDAFYENRMVVTDDCRFLNEAKAVREMGGIVVRIVRTTAEDELVGRGHESETEQLQIRPDITIDNSRLTMQEFEKQVMGIVRV